MLDPESEAWRKRIQLRQTEELWKAMRWLVLVIFLLNWYTWFLVIHRHWAQMAQSGSAIAAVGLLAFSPFPCMLMFLKREVYPPFAALLTYGLIGMAFGAFFYR